MKRLLKVGRKFFKPHLCPDCGALVMLVRHPAAMRCKKCRNKLHRKSSSHKKQQRKYGTAYQRRQKKMLRQQSYCALCGSTKHLTCHHTVSVRTGEWKGKHLTVLCDRCHRLWEMRVSTIRSLTKHNLEELNGISSGKRYDRMQCNGR